MSRAFVREDVDPPERSGRVRSASGLPPGAINYISARGAKRLRLELSGLQQGEGNRDRAAELEEILRSVTVVEPPESGAEDISLGATVTIKTKAGGIETFTIVGVNEIGFDPDGVTWISPIGKALLAAEVGQRVTIGEEPLGTVVGVEYRGS